MCTFFLKPQKSNCPRKISKNGRGHTQQSGCNASSICPHVKADIYNANTQTPAHQRAHESFHPSSHRPSSETVRCGRRNLSLFPLQQKVRCWPRWGSAWLRFRRLLHRWQGASTLLKRKSAPAEPRNFKSEKDHSAVFFFLSRILRPTYEFFHVLLHTSTTLQAVCAHRACIHKTHLVSLMLSPYYV